MLSIVTPAFNEAENLPLLYQRVKTQLDADGIEWQWVVVDDHSRDRTIEVVQSLAARDERVHGIRLARNAGSHAAIACGLHHADGQCAVMLAADLQDPPEVIPQLLERWRSGAQVVWAARRARPGDTAHVGFATIYYWVMRRIAGLTTMPERGADCFLADRVVLDAFRRLRERPVSVLALLTWLGFRQEIVEYDKAPRVHGRSGWTFRRKVALVFESVIAFSDLPIRLIAWAGAASLAAALALGVMAMAGYPDGAAGLTVVVAAMAGFAGLLLLALAIVGLYLWRALEEARARPPYIIERTVGSVIPA